MSLREDRVEALVKSYLAALISEHEPVSEDDLVEYEACKWRATGFLREQAHDWERIARDESLLEGIREFARQRGEAIREELRP